MSLPWQEDWDGNCLLLSACTNSTKLTSSHYITANYSAYPLSLKFYSCLCFSFALFLALSFAVGEISSVEQRDTREVVQPIQERQAGKTCILGSHSCPCLSICTYHFTLCVCIQCLCSSVYKTVQVLQSHSFFCLLLLLKRILCSYVSAAYIKLCHKVVHLFICVIPVVIFWCRSVFLRRQRREPGWCRPNDLFETAECHSQAGLHLHLPEFRRLVWQCVWLLPACSPLQGQQRRRADTSQKPLHQRRARRMPGQCSNMPGTGTSKQI